MTPPRTGAQLLTALCALTDPGSADAPPPFAVLHRPRTGPGGQVEVLVGDVVDVDLLTDVPRGGEVLALVPYRQVRELGYDAHDDGAPLRCLLVRERAQLPLAQALAVLPRQDLALVEEGFSVDDDTYAATVARVVAEEIGRGEGANFVVRRDHTSHLDAAPARAALVLLRRLLAGEGGAHWTFAVSAGDVVMVGATPEQHVGVSGGTVRMNPISGTLRHPGGAAPDAGAVLDFLADPKEVEELFMVVDEELKMMSSACAGGGRVLGPHLVPMAHVTHTEYVLAGRSDLDVREVLRRTLFAPTVTGSPVRNATRVITRHEPTGRGYYAGVLALIGTDADGSPALDAPILIRTAHLRGDAGAGGSGGSSSGSTVTVPVGATLVRSSVPAHEVAETHAKAAGVLAALRGDVEAGVRAGIGAGVRAAPDPAVLPGVPAALVARNAALAPFWRDAQEPRPQAALAGRSALVVDAEDGWTAMLAHLLRHLGLRPVVRDWADVATSGPAGADAYDLLVCGPGPGDPRATGDTRTDRLRALLAGRLAARRPLLAVCLSHQVLAALLGLPLAPLPVPHQGTQLAVDLFGRRTRVGSYNSFAARLVEGAVLPQGFDVAADPVTGVVHALRGPGVASVQGHLESVLSVDGVDVLADLLTGVLASSGPTDALEITRVAPGAAGAPGSTLCA